MFSLFGEASQGTHIPPLTGLMLNQRLISTNPTNALLEEDKTSGLWHSSGTSLISCLHHSSKTAPHVNPDTLNGADRVVTVTIGQHWLDKGPQVDLLFTLNTDEVRVFRYSKGQTYEWKKLTNVKELTEVRPLLFSRPTKTVNSDNRPRISLWKHEKTSNLYSLTIDFVSQQAGLAQLLLLLRDNQNLRWPQS